MKRYTVLLGALMLLYGCGENRSRDPGASSPPAERVRLVIYSPHGPEVLGDYEKRVEAAFPDVDVQWLDLGSQEVYSRIKAEQRRPYADVWWGGPTNVFARAAEEDLLEPYRPTWADCLEPEYRDPSDRWFGTYRTPLAIVFNSRQYTAKDVPQTWDELLENRWRGKLVFRKPLASGTMRTFIASMIERASSPDEGIAWLRRLHEATADYLESPQMLFDHLKRRPEHITVWLQPDVVLQRERNGYPLDCVVPPETIVLTEGIAIVKNAPHRAWAERFYEFVTSTESLIHQAHAYAKPPARGDIDPAALPDWMGDFSPAAMNIDVARFAEREAQWCARWEKEVYQRK